MFDALINGRIDTCGLDFEVSFADIEELNARVLAGTVDVCKISYAVLPAIVANYCALAAGSALGRGNGPLLVAREGVEISNISQLAVPGEYTTANLLIKRLLQWPIESKAVLFSEIAKRVADGEFDAGVLIHEGRFTYKKYGLHLLADLGVEWEKQTNLPLPLGGIVAKKSLGEEVIRQVENLVRQSVLYALKNPEASREFVREHAQEMAYDVIKSHISLFVNDFSVEIGEVGKRAIKELTGVE